MKPLGVTAISTEASDEQLVDLSKDGSSEAFALLFRRYRPAIARYAGRMLGDDARAEDIVQEVFLSALRSIDTLDRPAGFKPWLYRIAHNTSVDHMRRNGRNEEVFFDANRLRPSEEIRLFRQAPSSHAALSQKEDFKNLREAFAGLPPSQSEVLVMRELEGLSYDQIAVRMGVTRASVESTLFRARQGLRDEYGEIATGERCLRMKPVMARMAEGLGGLRDRRALARHVRGCQPCRRDALAMGLGGPALESPIPALRKGLSRVAALLPLPWFINRRPDETGAASSAGGGSGTFAAQAQTAISQISSTAAVSADHAATALQKAVAVVAAVAVVGGGGYVASQGDSRSELLLKSERNTLPSHKDVSAAVPPALAPLARAGERTTATAPGALPALAGAAAPAAALTPLGPTQPTGITGPLKSPADPGALVDPGEPPATLPTGEAPAETAPSDPTSDSGATLPTAGDTGSGSETTGGGGSPSEGSSGGGDGGGDSGGSPSPLPDTGGTPSDSTDPPPASGCDLPHGLDKKDKIPPGHEKKCALEAAAEPVAP